MMLKREELQQKEHIATTTPAAFETVVPTNMRRYIYKIKTLNEFNGVNVLSINRGSATVIGDLIDTIAHVLIYDQWIDPEELKLDAAPLYILEAGEWLWLTASAAGNIRTMIWYADAE